MGDPANPVRLGGYSTRGGTGGLQVVGDLAYLAAHWEFQILDVSQPERPVRVGGLYASTVGLVWDVHVVGNLAYLSTSSGLQILDVSRLVQPRLRIDWGGEFPALQLSGIVGANYMLEHSPSLPGSNWTALSTVTVSEDSETFLDATSAMGSQRFYRVRLVP